MASTEISFKATDLDLYEHLWLGLADMPVVSVQSVTYDHTQRIDFQNETWEKAILAAREKATASAKTPGVAIGPPLLLEEDHTPSEGWQMNWGNALLNNNVRAAGVEGRGLPQALAPGIIPIRIRVKAAFPLLPRK